ncbi:MAG: amidohydrolase family protein [Pseudomonadota bacterium]
MRDVLVPRTLLRDPAGFGGAPDGDCLRGDLVVTGARVTGMTASEATKRPRMVIPALAEAHCHLDKCHTIARLGAVGGDLRQAIARQWDDKANWTEDDLRTRAGRGLRGAEAAGCSALRTHVDWGTVPEPPLAWSVMADMDSPLELQRAALLGIDQWADPDFAAAVGPHLHGGVPGAFILGHDKTREGLRAIFGYAIAQGAPLDFHVDEGLGDLDGVEAVADMALEMRFDGPILCGHAVGLMDKAPADFARIAEKCARAGITICALPTTNLYLQGRSDGTPDRRGLTRLRELRAAGVPVIVASDNVGDAFCPTGQHDPMAALHLAHLAAHLDPPMSDWLGMITTDARKALGLEPIYVDGAPQSALRQSSAASVADLVAGRAPLTPLMMEH